MYSLFSKIKVLRFTLIYCLLFTLFSVVNFSCNTHQPTSLNSETDTLDLNKSMGVDYKKIEGELNKLLNHLCQTPQLLSPDIIRKAADRHVTLSELKLDDKFPAEFRLEDGNIFKVHIELFNGSAANELSIESAPVYFVLDPDRFPNASQYMARGDGGTFTASVAATKLNQSKGIYQGETSQKQLNLNSKTEKVDYLLFFVGGEEYLSAENEEKINQEMRKNQQMLAKAQSISTTYHLWLIRLRLRAKKDNSNEEFELYTVYGLGTGYTFGARTSHQFNGGWHTDASGYTRLYPDVNNINTWYTPSHPIAVTYNGYHKFQFTAIEDDYSTGSHKNDHDGGGKHSENLWGWEFVDRVGRYGVLFWFYIDDDVTDDDDIYECSYTGWDADPNNYQEMLVSTAHVDYVFRLGTVYQADNNWP